MECKHCTKILCSRQSLDRHMASYHPTLTPAPAPTLTPIAIRGPIRGSIRGGYIQVGPKFDERFKHPFTCMVTGPTKAGKTEFVKRFVMNLRMMMTTLPHKVYWCYTEWQPTYEDIPATFISSKQLGQMNLRTPEPKLIIFDDMMREVETMTELFTKGSHHWNMSVIHITQDLFYDKRRTNRINTQYIVMMKNPGDKLTPNILARQMGIGDKFMRAYNAATAKPHGYLLVDMEQNTPDMYRLRTNIFPDQLTIFY